jgi:hypothetical protein
LDPTDPTKLKPNIRSQLAAMQGAVGTTINGIVVKNYKFHIRGSIDPAVQTVLTNNGLTAHFIAR